MTNRERLMALNDKELGEMLKKLAQNPLFEYVDCENWLKSDNSQFIYNGKKGKVKLLTKPFENEETDCIVVGYKDMLGYPYRQVLVIDKDGTTQFYSVPAEQVTVFV